MKKISEITIVSLMLFCAFSTVSAQLQDYTTLAPLPGVKPTTNLTDYLPNVFNLSIGIAAVLAFIVITIGGVLYATTDALSGKSQGREYITNAIWGLLLVIGSYVILYTINPQILDFSVAINQSNIKVSAPTVTAGTPMTQEQIAADQAVRSRLEAGGIGLKAPCLQGQVTGCVNVNGLPDSAIDGLITLKTACGCTIFLTGGTEPGAHQTHGVGAPIVDIRPDVNLNKFISGNANTPQDGYSAPGGKTWKNHHAFFTYESAGGNAGGTSTGNHWHVVIDN
jgi:hypothetical protein